MISLSGTPARATSAKVVRIRSKTSAALSLGTLVGEPAATKTAGALSRLMGSMMIHSGVTLDDVVKEMLKPMLKEWLDANLPALVEAEVEKEIERIRRMAR